MQHPEEAKAWHTFSNYLVLLTTEDESSLEKLIYKAESKGIKYTIFREPDIDNQITSVAFEPCEKTRKLLSNLPLLGKNNN